MPSGTNGDEGHCVNPEGGNANVQCSKHKLTLDSDPFDARIGCQEGTLLLTRRGGVSLGEHNQSASIGPI
jgi:hypothetical protein